MSQESHHRSLLKAISWRVTASTDTLLISWLITGKIGLALSISGVEILTKIGIYYLHERIWDRIPLGRAKVVKDNFEI